MGGTKQVDSLVYTYYVAYICVYIILLSRIVRWALFVIRSDIVRPLIKYRARNAVSPPTSRQLFFRPGLSPDNYCRRHRVRRVRRNVGTHRWIRNRMRLAPVYMLYRCRSRNCSASVTYARAIKYCCFVVLSVHRLSTEPRKLQNSYTIIIIIAIW